MAPVSGLRLEAVNYQGSAQWDWNLTGANSEFLGTHKVRLDERCWQFEAFNDLPGYLRTHVPPDRRIAEEARIVAETGQWIGEQILGPLGAIMAAMAPVTVRVIVPREATPLAFRPLELAHAVGRPLAAQDVILVLQPSVGSAASGREDMGTGDSLRVLGLFSLPEWGSALNLRRERQALVKLFARIAATGRAVDFRALQYGVTREKLHEVLAEGGGWDIIHISGHGAPGELLLEAADGSPDPVSGSQLAGLLARSRERLKLVTVSACWSAALTAAAERSLLGLPEPEEPGEQVNGREPDRATVGAVVAELSRLSCGVLAMRYRVTDHFAIALAERLYSLLADEGQQLPRALGIALMDREVVADPPTGRSPALSVATPALFGEKSADLLLAAPLRSGSPRPEAGVSKLARLPQQPERFVGRTSVMARASAALAPHSGSPGLLLHGMPGGGKSACALELAYTHEHAFGELVWFKAPDQGLDAPDAITKFALTLERELAGLQMVHLLDSAARLSDYLPSLTRLLDERRILIVIDNIESLLTENGRWKDARWGALVAAMTAHGGLGRVVLTSRVRLHDLNGRMRTEAVDALTLDEALLLARELPNVGALISGGLPGLSPATSRMLGRRVLDVTQGHPALLGLVDGQAANPGKLQALVEAGDRTWQRMGGLPDGFFATGESQAAGEDYLHVLEAWTRAVAGTLASGDQLLLFALCCLEEDDRERFVIQTTWPRLWQKLGQQADHPPDLDASLAMLTAHGLITAEPGAPRRARPCQIHPVVAAACRDQAGAGFRAAVDNVLASFWNAVAQLGQEREPQARTSGLVIRAGLAAAPYLLRLERWGLAAELLQNVLIRDQSRATASAALPALRQIAAAVSGTADEQPVNRLLAKALEATDLREAERHVRAVLADALAREDYRAASSAMGELIRYCRIQGRLDEALDLAEAKMGYTQQAGLGPWTLLADEGERLQVLAEMGQGEHVLAEVQRLRAHMKTLPDTSAHEETAVPWNAREVLLDIGVVAAVQQERWEEALDLNSEQVAILTGRGAPDTDIARTRFNDYAALLELGRTDEAIQLLRECWEIFERAADLQGLGNVLSALADAEQRRGRGMVALGLERDALRFKYRTGAAREIAGSHQNLGNFLRRHARDPGTALAHHLAAALIRALARGHGLQDSIQAAAYDLRLVNDDAVSYDVAALRRRVAETPGVDLGQLIARLAPDPQEAQDVLENLIARARSLAEEPAIAPSRYLAAWDPIIAGMVAARSGDGDAAAAVDEELTHREDAGSAALIGALRRLQDGDNDQHLLAGLDEIDTPIARRALDAVAGTIFIPSELWPAIPLRGLLSALVAAGEGDAAAGELSGELLDALETRPDLADLVQVLRRILRGDRDSGLVTDLDHLTGRAIVFTVLRHIGNSEPEAV